MISIDTKNTNTLIEQKLLQVELKIYEKLLKLFYECSDYNYRTTYNINQQLNINKVLPYVVKEIGELKNKLDQQQTPPTN